MLDVYSEWLVTGKDVDGNYMRFVIHGHTITEAVRTAIIFANRNWGHGGRIDSLVRQRTAEEMLSGKDKE